MKLLLDNFKINNYMDMLKNLFRSKSNKIERSGDLVPKGIKYTIKGNYDFNETFQHMYQERFKK